MCRPLQASGGDDVQAVVPVYEIGEVPVMLAA